MPKYLIFWRFKREQFGITDPEKMEKVLGMLMSEVSEYLKNGKLQDWGVSLDGAHGYGIFQMEALELQKYWMLKAPYVEALKIFPVTNFEETQKNMQTAVETRKAMQK